MDKALSEFLKFLVFIIMLLCLTHFNILTRTNLSFFQDSIFTDVGPYFVIVYKTVIFTNFAHKVFCVIFSLFQKVFNNMEYLLFNLSRGLNVKLTLGHY